jgi:hypothetical protein
LFDVGGGDGTDDTPEQTFIWTVDDSSDNGLGEASAPSMLLPTGTDVVARSVKVGL